MSVTAFLTDAIAEQDLCVLLGWNRIRNLEVSLSCEHVRNNKQDQVLCCHVARSPQTVLLQHACKPDFWFYSTWSIAQYDLMKLLWFSIKVFMLVCSDNFFLSIDFWSHAIFFFFQTSISYCGWLWVFRSVSITGQTAFGFNRLMVEIHPAK